MTAYRLHFEEGNLQAVELVKDEEIGEARLFESTHTMQVEPDNIRIDRELGGGPLEDIGIYCINAARYLFRDEPTEVTAFAARGTDERFVEVPESVSAVMRFPGERLAAFSCGFGATKVSQYRVLGTDGMLVMDPAYTWNDATVRTLVRNGKERSKTFKHRDQIAAEIVYFADCIQEGKDPEPSGKEGWIDVRIIEALRDSYDNHRVVKLEPLEDDAHPDETQSIERRPGRQPEPVNAEAPSQE
jgi:glucose-fructose oxidoreductase